VFWKKITYHCPTCIVADDDVLWLMRFPNTQHDSRTGDKSKQFI